MFALKYVYYRDSYCITIWFLYCVIDLDSGVLTCIIKLQ